MKNIFLFKDLQIIDYKKAWDFQKELFEQVLKSKNESETANHKQYVLFCEHPHVYTLGKNGERNNLLINDDFLKKIEATYFQIDRGGDITYHGPQQLVCYPIFNLESLKISVKEYVYKIEQSIIEMLREFSIESSRIGGAAGIWLDTNKLSPRKICAIGVKVSNLVTMHGFALNVNTDLSYFNYINPCGFVDKGVTSLEKELGHKVDFDKIKNLVKIKFAKTFGFEWSE